MRDYIKNILNTELKQLVDLLSQIQDTTNFNAYLEKIKTPDKTLVVLIKLKEKALNYYFENSTNYADYYRSVLNDDDLMSYSTKINDPFNDSVIYNDYEDFINRTYHIIMGRLKN